MAELFNYDSKKKLIFADTIPEGQYIKAFTFIDHYAKQVEGARDNQGHPLKLVTLGDTLGLVNPDMSRQHASTGDPHSSTHADLYLRKRETWGNIGDISNHTGIAREPTNAKKLDRYANWNL